MQSVRNGGKKLHFAWHEASKHKGFFNSYYYYCYYCGYYYYG